ncbi:thiamine pyrophosphate-binding protein [Streptomyces sp. NPDC058737]|uniref:thiamine pyrophosphate-binding protein n=1 Tax=Streptomyces sp. NPDC058737 TaxID=3346617 RepID=UPI0036A433E3
MTQVADLVLQRLTERGVKRVYGCPGDGINGLLGAFGRADGGPDLIRARHGETAGKDAKAAVHDPERAGIAGKGVRRKLAEYAEHLPGRH